MFKQKREYDLILGMGSACNCTQALREAGLQNRSYPFDWLFGPKFSDRVQILINKFDKFFDLKDLKPINKTELDRFIVKNHYTNIFHNHDFYIDFGSLEQQYPKVKAKYDRRINRVLKLIDGDVNRKILLVYFQRPVKSVDGFEEYSENDLNNMIKNLEKTFKNCEFNILFVKSKDEMYPDKIKYLKSKSSKIMLAVTYNRYKQIYSEEYLFYHRRLVKILNHYKIRYKYYNIYKRRIERLYFLLQIVFG